MGAWAGWFRIPPMIVYAVKGNGVVKFVRPIATAMHAACRPQPPLSRVGCALHGACAFHRLARVRPPQERM